MTNSSQFSAILKNNVLVMSDAQSKLLAIPYLGAEHGGGGNHKPFRLLG